MHVEEKFVETKFGKICYLESGDGDKVFYFFHGFWGDPRGIYGLASILIPKGFKVIAPYLPGHGKSHSLPRNYKFSNLIEEITEFISLTSNKSKIILFGNSLGGGLVINLTKSVNPDKIIVSVPLLKELKWTDFSRGFWEVTKDRIVDGLAAPHIKNKRQEYFLAEIPAIKKFWLRDLWSGIRLIDSYNIENNHTENSLLIRGDKDWVSNNHEAFDFKKRVILPGRHYYFLRQYDRLFGEIEKFV